MQYEKIYHKLILKAKKREMVKADVIKLLDFKERWTKSDIKLIKNSLIFDLTHQHHIIPRCMGGTDDKNNLVELSLREHYLAHKLLKKIHPDHVKIRHAQNEMRKPFNGMKRNNMNQYKKCAYQIKSNELMIKYREQKRIYFENKIIPEKNISKEVQEFILKIK